MKEKYETSSDDHTKCIKMQVVAILKMNRIGFQLPRTTETVSQGFGECDSHVKCVAKQGASSKFSSLHLP